MASNKPPNQPDAADARRRPPATIDLAATEVHVEPEAPAAKAAPAAPDLAQADPIPNSAPEGAAEGGKNVPEVMEQPPLATFYDETRANERRAAQGGGAPPGHEPPSESGMRGDADTPHVPPAAGFPWALLAAAIGGGAFAALLLAGLFYADILPPQPSVPADAALSARLARLEGQVAVRNPAPAADRGAADAAVKDLAARLDKLETAVARPPAPATDAAMAARVTALEAATKSAATDVAALNGRFADVNAAEKEMRERDEALAASVTQLKDAMAQQPGGTGRDDLDKLAARIAALEASTRSLQQKVETLDSAAANREVRFAVLAAALQDAVVRGAPFASALEGVRPLAGDAQALGQLQPFAATGLPPAAALGKELAALVPAMDRIATPSAAHGGTFLDKLQASAGRLVRIRPVEDAAGNDPVATVDRIENRAAQGDIDGALSELAKLPANVRAPAEGWIAKAQRRQAALGAAQKISADALAALAKPAQQKAAQ